MKDYTLWCCGVTSGTMFINLLSGDYLVTFITGIAAMLLFIGWRKIQ